MTGVLLWLIPLAVTGWLCSVAAVVIAILDSGRR